MAYMYLRNMAKLVLKSKNNIIEMELMVGIKKDSRSNTII